MILHSHACLEAQGALIKVLNVELDFLVGYMKAFDF